MARVRSRIKWYVASLEDNNTQLRRTGPVLVWNPVQIIRHLVDGEMIEEAISILPGYVLIGSYLDWKDIEQLTGVVLLRTRKCSPVPLTQKELDRIRLLVDCEQNIFNHFVVGDKIRVSKGPFAGLLGCFLREVRSPGGCWAEVVIHLYDEREITELLPLDYLEIG